MLFIRYNMWTNIPSVVCEEGEHRAGSQCWGQVVIQLTAEMNPAGLARKQPTSLYKAEPGSWGACIKPGGRWSRLDRKPTLALKMGEKKSAFRWQQMGRKSFGGGVSSLDVYVFYHSVFAWPNLCICVIVILLEVHKNRKSSKKERKK